MDIQFILAESDYRGGGLKAQKALRISLFYCRSKGIGFGFASCLKNQWLEAISLRQLVGLKMDQVELKVFVHFDLQCLQE